MIDLSTLNPPQREAVETTKGALLVLAGAGSGKTRALTYRIAHLVEQGVAPWNILAITFTNKAAREMKERIAALLPNGGDVWVGTFHSICVRILRREIEHLSGYTKAFTIYDGDDQVKLASAILKELELNEKMYPPREILSKISAAKDEMLSPQEYALKPSDDFRHKFFAETYKMYDQRLRAANALDFDDLIIKTLELFAAFPDVLAYYSARFHYIHVDEYQDTNYAQYMLVKLLSSQHSNLCVVGDDDQSIYAWRGADIRNILEFEKDFPSAHVVRLEQNYRSTGYILQAANAVIANNVGRKEKALWTDKGDGEKLCVIPVRDEQEEADALCSEIRSLMKTHGYRYSDFAVLYRINAQSRVPEMALSRNGIPYRIYGGQKFFDRMEVKDAIAYLRVLVNPSDEISLMRVVNTPRRGIGPAAIEAWQTFAKSKEVPLFSALFDLEEAVDMPLRLRQPLERFTTVIRGLLALRDVLPLPELMQHVLEDTGLMAQYRDNPNDENQTRLENLKELLGAVKEFQDTHEDATLETYLDTAALVADVDNLQEDTRAVTMMTLHSAKGLEFPVVFILGAEEGFFPHSRAQGDDAQLEEERRLCYVGITRARQRAYLLHTSMRNIFGSTRSSVASRFLAEIPEETVEVRRTGQTMRRQDTLRAANAAAQKRPPNRSFGAQPVRPAATAPAPSAPAPRYNVGEKVKHNIFGSGTVVGIKGDGDKAMLSVAFDGKGVKQLSAGMAPLTRLK